MSSPEVPEGFSIAYQDEHLIVIDKGPGLVVHPARGHREDTLAQLLAPLAAGGEPERAGIVHRLGRRTPGPRVVPPSPGAHPNPPAGAPHTGIGRQNPRPTGGPPPT